MIDLPRKSVPCNGCTTCCRNGDLIILQPEDDPDQYETEQFGEFTVLRARRNGDCWYLGEHGCTIHDRAPSRCRSFDCRVLIEAYSRQQRRSMVKRGLIHKDQLKAAHARIRRGNTP